jgi:plastocyanin/mono/diheme cytochrome c family protein
MGGNLRNPGLLAVTAGVGLAVIFAAAGAAGIIALRLGLGLAVVCLVTAALVYIFYSRANAITRTGYSALLMIIATGLLIPMLTITQQQQQVSAADQLYDLKLHNGAALFGTYCATCHGFLGQGLQAPQLNNNPNVNTLSDDDLTRIISGGIANTDDPKKLLMPAWLQAYGGSLTEEDISYLVALIRSSDPKYRQQNGLANVNGFSYVFGTLTNPTQIAEYNHEKNQIGQPSVPPLTQFQSFVGKPTVTVPITNTPSAANANWNFTPANIIISVGTKVTWNNQSSAPHTVTPKTTSAPTGFGSGILTAGTGTYSFTFTQKGTYEYFCSIHPAMIGWIIVQ